MVDETTLVACGLCSLVQADACTVFRFQRHYALQSAWPYIIVEGPRAVPPLWMLRLVEGKIEPALVVPACKL